MTDHKEDYELTIEFNTSTTPQPDKKNIFTSIYISIMIITGFIIHKRWKNDSNNVEQEGDDRKDDDQKNNASEWIENVLKSKKVNFISYNELNNSKPLITGSFGCIVRSTWTKIDNYVVYKKLINANAIKGDILNAFIHELQIHLHLDYSDRIVRCLGISQGNNIFKI